MRFVWLVFLVAGSATVGKGNLVSCSHSVQGYYWRDYIGVIPDDAVPGGKDEKGETTFIGQALHPGGRLTPGVIKEGKKQVFYEFGNGAHEAEEDVKILCSQHPEQLVWLHVYVGNSILNINGTQLIIAGHDASGPLSIGRKVMGSEVGVGKVLLSNSQFVGLWYATSASKYELFFDDFEILVFNSKAEFGKNTCAQKTINVNFYC